MPKLSEQEKQTFRSWAVWEEAKCGLDLEQDDFDECFQTAVAVAESEGTNFAKEWLSGLFHSYTSAERTFREAAERREQDALAQDQAFQLKLDNSRAAVLGSIANAAAHHKPTSLEIDRVYTYRSKYPNLNLSFEEIAHLNSVTRLADTDLQAVNTNLAGYHVESYSLIAVNGGAYHLHLRMPYKVGNFPFSLGPEISRDWVVPRPGHGFPLKTIHDAWKAVQAHPDLIPAEASTNGNWMYQMNKKRLVLNAGKDTVITYFDTDYGA